MAYSDKVMDHYNNPRNVGRLDKADKQVGTGMVGAPACGDVMQLQIKVDAKGVIEDAKFKTYGCGSAIASSSLLTEWVKRKSLDDAIKIKNTDIATELSLPPVKIHCSVLAEDAIKAAAKGAIEKSSQLLKNPATPSSGSGTVYIGKPRPNITPKTGVTKMTAIPIKGEIEALPKQKADPHPINKKMEEFVSNQRQSKPKGMSEMEWMENKNL